MDVYVKGFNPPEETYTLLDLCFYLMRKAFTPCFEQWPEEVQNAWRTNGCRSETFAPDGDSVYNEPTGTINFYVMGIEPPYVEQVLDEVKNKLHDIGVEHGPFKRDGYKDGVTPGTRVIRIPITSNQNDRDGEDLPPEIHRSNANMIQLLKHILDFQPDDAHHSCFTMDARELELKTQMMMDAPSSELSMQRGSGYREDIISLNKLARWALDHGFDTVYAT